MLTSVRAERDLPKVAHRYELLAELGRGGLGAVFQARDLATGREVALKTLTLVTPQTVLLFEREYHLLSTIKHPSVISVFDFGFAEGDARYYTMEILPGKDLSSLVPLPWNQACVHLRDVAVSLSLLHARRLLHRDVSPKNIRFDARGRVKLIDFGALCPFGSRSDVVGTPLCIAPEVLEQAVLDQRADLYSLGVVLYVAITGRRPFAIRELADIEAAVRVRPDPPSKSVPDIPVALDELVLSMLSIQPNGRPTSAAEVAERLGALAGVGDDDRIALAHSHVVSVDLCGREREMVQLRRHIVSAARGQGGTVVITGASGVGKSRLVSEALVAGRLSALSAVRVDALGHPRLLGVAGAIALCVVEALALDAERTLARRPGLRAAVSQWRSARLATASAAATTSRDEEQSALQQELADWLLEVAREYPLLIVVDDAHASDPISAGMLAALAHRARAAPLLLVVTQLLGEPIAPSLQQLGRLAARIKLRALGPDGMQQFVQSAFGDAPHSARLTQWLADLTLGNPAQFVHYLNQLIQTGAITYSAASWSLPQSIDTSELPRTRRGVLEATVSRLDALALHLGRVLAVHRGPLTSRICTLCLVGAETNARLLEALDGLVLNQMVGTSGDNYYVGEEAIRDVLLGSLGAEDVRRLHLLVAKALLSTSWNAGVTFADVSTADLVSLLQAGFHFVRGGQSARGRVLLRDAGLAMTTRGEGLTYAIPALERAFEVYREEQLDDFELLPLTAPLALAGTYIDFRLTYRYGIHTLETCAAMCGVQAANRLRPFVGRHLALMLAMPFAMARLKLISRSRTIYGFSTALLGLIGIGSAVLGVATVLLDSALAQRIMKMLAPLDALPRSTPARTAHDFQRAMLESSLGNYTEARRVAFDVLRRLKAPSKLLPETARLQLELGVMVLRGSLECFRVDGDVEVPIRALESSPAASSRQSAAGTRAMFHALRGEREQFEHFRRALDLLSAQFGGSWRQDVLMFRALWFYQALSEDILGLKHSLQALETISREAHSLRGCRDAAAALYMASRGRAAEALVRYRDSLSEASSTLNELNLRFIATFARLERLAGNAASAQQRCATALGGLEPPQFEFVVAVRPLQHERVLALIDLGRLREARELADALVEDDERHDNPLLRGLTYKTRALVAMAADDHVQFARDLTQMRAWFERCQNPSLIAQCDALALRRTADGSTNGARSADAASSAATASAIRAHLARYRGTGERQQAALEIIVSESHAQRGYLFLVESTGGLRFAAPVSEFEPPDELRSRLAEQLRAVCADDDATVAVDRTEKDFDSIVRDELDDDEPSVSTEGRPCPAVFLTIVVQDRLVPVGAVALVLGHERLVEVDAGIASAVAASLYDSNDPR